MEQLSLLDGAYARRSDPHTAHEAAQRVNVTDLESVVLEALRALGPSTSHEVAAHTGLDLVTVSPRFKPLEKKGLVRRRLNEIDPFTGRVFYETRIGKSGRASVVWHLV
jgi:DNA-binding MarR family transcriptional regulator